MFEDPAPVLAEGLASYLVTHCQSGALVTPRASSLDLSSELQDLLPASFLTLSNQRGRPWACHSAHSHWRLAKGSEGQQREHPDCEQ